MARPRSRPPRPRRPGRELGDDARRCDVNDGAKPGQAKTAPAKAASARTASENGAPEDGTGKDRGSCGGRGGQGQAKGGQTDLTVPGRRVGPPGGARRDARRSDLGSVAHHADPRNHGRDADASFLASRDAFGGPIQDGPSSPSGTAYGGGPPSTARLAAKANAREYLSVIGGREVSTAGVAGVLVTPEYRGTGLARQVMMHLLGGRARADGAAVSTLFRTAPALYRSLGYEQVAEQTHGELPAAALRGLRVRPPSHGAPRRRRRTARRSGPVYAPGGRGRILPADQDGPLLRRHRPGADRRASMESPWRWIRTGRCPVMSAGIAARGTSAPPACSASANCMP